MILFKKINWGVEIFLPAKIQHVFKTMAEVYESTSFRDNNFISVSEDVWTQVSEDGLRGAIGYWHVYEGEDDVVVVLADDKIQREEFTFADTSQYYDEKDSGDRDIRPPREVQNVLELHGFNPVVFLIGYPDMFRDDLSAVFLLNAHQLSELLPSHDYILDALPVTPKKTADAGGRLTKSPDDGDRSRSEKKKIRGTIEQAVHDNDDLDRFSIDVTVPGESALRSA